MLLSSQNGDQTGRGLTPTGLEVNAANATIDLGFDEPPARAEVVTTNGAVIMSLPDTDYAITVTTATGEVTSELRESPGSNSRITVTTDNGDITLNAQ